MQQQRGFSLIELMIVVAIIGILAAIAVPAYQEFVARGQAAEGLTATGGVRSEVGVHLSEDGALPDRGDSSALDEAIDQLAGRYFSVGGVVNGAGGVISVTFDNGIHSGNTMIITPVQNAAGTQVAEWQCSGLDMRYLPNACKP